MNDYEVHRVIGEGAHGIVLKAIHKQTLDVVALKKISLKSVEDGISVQAFREIKSLEQLTDSENIVKLRSVFAHCMGFVLAFDFMPSDLDQLIKLNVLSTADKKSYMKQLLLGVSYMHGLHIIHRDLKPANLLISFRGVLKIGDFSLARLHLPNGEDKRPYTHTVATRWYRAPELLFGSKSYTEGVDLWAVGCIIAELIRGEVLFKGDSDIDQIAQVFKVLGTPDDTTWPELSSLPDAGKITFPTFTPVPFKTLVETSTEGLNLVGGYLLYRSDDRLSAGEGLLHPYFKEQPLPSLVSSLPKVKMNNGH